MKRSAHLFSSIKTWESRGFSPVWTEKVAVILFTYIQFHFGFVSVNGMWFILHQRHAYGSMLLLQQQFQKWKQNANKSPHRGNVWIDHCTYVNRPDQKKKHHSNSLAWHFGWICGRYMCHMEHLTEVVKELLCGIHFQNWVVNVQFEPLDVIT